MKLPWFSLLLLFFGNYSRGQSFSKNQIDISVGFGVIKTFYSPGLSPLVIANCAADYGVSKNISVGGFATGLTSEKGYYGKTWVSSPQNPGWLYWNEMHVWRTVIAGVKTAYHLNDLFSDKKMDAYFGVLIGNKFVSHSYSSSAPYPPQDPVLPDYKGGLMGAVFAGCRYRFNEQAGVFAEIGYGITYFNFGLNYRVNL